MFSNHSEDMLYSTVHAAYRMAHDSAQLFPATDSGDSHVNGCSGTLQELPGADWKKGLEAGQRVRARIIYVDAAAKRVCLSLLPHLVAARTDSLLLPPINTLFEVGTCCQRPLACTPLQLHTNDMRYRYPAQPVV